MEIEDIAFPVAMLINRYFSPSVNLKAYLWIASGSPKMSLEFVDVVLIVDLAERKRCCSRWECRLSFTASCRSGEWWRYVVYQRLALDPIILEKEFLHQWIFVTGRNNPALVVQLVFNASWTRDRWKCFVADKKQRLLVFLAQEFSAGIELCMMRCCKRSDQHTWDPGTSDLKLQSWLDVQYIYNWERMVRISQSIRFIVYYVIESRRREQASCGNMSVDVILSRFA